MSELRELSYKEISYIRSALEGYIGLLKLDIESEEIDDDERMDLQEDLLFYEKLLYTFQKSEKQSVDLKQIQSIAIKKR
ncbi:MULTISPECIES: hypothetical protein [Microbulbifer]|uniref:Uncharacterized protein n=1 Tax=Microbulbifer epialgicus TaxID=393907 RepID=A0ABV4P7J1_9GAMM|nr:hypothetical protein [Microbulbifer sp. A4B17]AWF80227.1 hypothetical protein BTJ40_05050 [Microbulbifer sp. A4B17]